MRALLALPLAIAVAADGAEQGPDANVPVTEAADDKAMQCVLKPGKTPMEDTVVCEGRTFELERVAHEAEELPLFSPNWWICAGCCLFCITCAALAAGLTMGLVSMDEFEVELLLEMKKEELPEGEERDALEAKQRHAKKIQPLISKHFFQNAFSGGCCVPHKLDPTNHHYLLVTLLVMNALANEALPVFLDNLVPAWGAVLISVTLVLIFGEIIPSAIFTGPNQLAIAAKFAGFVSFLKLLLMPVVWPISMLLDMCLEHATTTFNRAQIKALVRMTNEGDAEKQDDYLAKTGLARDEIDMIHGALDLHRLRVEDIKENLEDAKMLPRSTVLNENTLADLLAWGHSRIFVYETDKTNIRGVLLVKNLIVIDPNQERPLEQLHLRKPSIVNPKDSLLATLNHFQTGRSHMAIISEDPEAVKAAWKNDTPIPKHAQPTGFLTLEDIIEELIKEEVFDEDDREKALAAMGGHKGKRMKRLRSLKRAAGQRVVDKKAEEERLKEEKTKSSRWASLSRPMLRSD